MFVFDFCTFDWTVAETDRLNGIFDAIFEMRFGDVGSDAITGISSTDGSSFVNVFCRISIGSGDCSTDFAFPSGDWRGGSVDADELFVFDSFEVNDGRIFLNDSALRWINDFGFCSTDAGVVLIDSLAFTVGVFFGEAIFVVGGVLTAGGVIDLMTGGATGFTDGRASRVILYGET